MDPDAARELKASILERLPTAVEASALPGEHEAPWPWVAVGLSPSGSGARVAVRLQRDGDRALLPDLGPAAAEVDVRVIGPVRSLSTPGQLQRAVRPLRPGLSVAHVGVSAGTLGGFVRTSTGLAILSNNHVLAASNAASVGDAVLQPGPADGGRPADRVATLAGFPPMGAGVNLVDAAVATLDEGVVAEPGDVPGGPSWTSSRRGSRWTPTSTSRRSAARPATPTAGSPRWRWTAWPSSTTRPCTGSTTRSRSRAGRGLQRRR
ncbi:hypothetical protein [Blastococcus brunescens]|uniref:Trypsin-like peptidase domain-containing protein n=1 Tax=Blastococcus brunescens TaxID=1564165 RepID=A0ABZ1B236_9ACTN|nr:hypothetical protein [Blastococcus sp. BMG 8361]WRL63085.1 hypothetical protein U6N30_25215 [Blastococcus sp. BMG 8361]